MFPPVSQICFQSFHFYVSTFGHFCEMKLKKVLANFVAADEIEVGFGNKIPLWLVGFLY
jgi:hypothetical protein